MLGGRLRISCLVETCEEDRLHPEHHARLVSVSVLTAAQCVDLLSTHCVGALNATQRVDLLLDVERHRRHGSGKRAESRARRDGRW